MTAAQGQALENAIFANPDDLGAHAAYADWLMEQGDPRGEFIQVQLGLEDEQRPAADRQTLRDRERVLLAEHGQTWLGALGQPTTPRPGLFRRLFGGLPRSALPPFEHRFARGWLDSLSTHAFDPNLARALANEPAGRLLRRLDLIGGVDYTLPLDELAQARFLGNVRYFRLGDPDESCRISGAGVEEVIRLMPRLEELTLLAHDVDTAALFALDSLSNLTSVRLEHSRASHLEVLAANPTLGRLQSLAFWPHAIEPGDEASYVPLAGVRALLQAPHLKNVRHLELHLSDLGDEGCQLLAQSGWLSRLHTLDLSIGRISDEGAHILARAKGLEALQKLDLSQNCLTPAGIDVLRGTGVNLVVKDQWQAGVSPEGDLEYLYYGDIE